MTNADGADAPVQLAAAIADELRAQSAVAGVSGGPLGTIATHGPRRKVVGVRVPGLGEPIDIGLVLWLQPRRLTPIADELRPHVRTLAGAVEVNIEIVDVALTASSADPPSTAPPQEFTRS